MNFAVKVSNVYKASTFEPRVIIVRKGKTLFPFKSLLFKAFHRLNDIR